MPEARGVEISKTHEQSAVAEEARKKKKKKSEWMSVCIADG